MHILLLQSEFKSELNTKTTKTNGKNFNHNLFKFNDIKEEEKSKREEKTTQIHTRKSALSENSELFLLYNACKIIVEQFFFVSFERLNMNY